MKKFKIEYSFNGHGEIIISAKNMEEAEEKFFEGAWDGEENEWGESSFLENTTEIK